MEEIQKTGRSELWNMSFRDLFYKYVRYLPLFILSVALCLFAAYVYLRYTVPLYKVGGSMIIKSEQPGGGRSQGFEEQFINDRAQNIQSEIEILKSKPLMARVVDSLHLQLSYYAIGKIKTVNVYKTRPFDVQIINVEDSSRSFALKINFVSDNEFKINGDDHTYRLGDTYKNKNGTFIIKGFPNTPASGEFKVYWTSTAAAAAGYAGALQVTPKSAGTGILNISMITNNSELGADIINELMEEYALYTIEQKREESEKTLAFINSRLLVTSGQLDSIQQAVINYRNKHNIIDGEAQTAQGFNNLSEFDKTIIEQRTELTKAEIVESYLNDRKNEFSKVPSTLWIDEPVFANLVGEYNKVQIERLALINSGAGKDNPLVLEKNIAVEKGRERVLESLKSTKKLLNDIIATATSKSQSSQQQLKAMPAIQKDLAKMEESAISITTLKNYLEQEREKTAIKIASATANSTPTDRAAPTSTPVKPNRKAIQILAFLLGLGLPALFIFISEILNDKVSTRFDIEKITNTPIVGEIGHSYSNNTLVVSKTTRSMVAEQFRIIRSNLQYILGKAEKSTILVTSSFSGEGKSYATTNMGAVLALAGKKTVILEFDIRKPKLISGLGMPKGPGITNFLVGKGNLEDLIKPVADNENLFVLGCGPVPPNPAELLLDPKMDELFEWLQARFDIILVDTAPVGMVSDAMTLSKYAQCTLYMVRQGHTFKKQIALIDEFYSSNKLPKISIIINDVKIKPGYGYYGYGRYGYGQGYGYGSYYEEETPPHNFFERILAAIGSIFRKKKKN